MYNLHKLLRSLDTMTEVELREDADMAARNMVKATTTAGFDAALSLADLVIGELNWRFPNWRTAPTEEPRVNYATLIDPEQEYPVSYAYHQQRGRIEAPVSGVMPGKDLTEPQIIELYRAGLLA